MAGLCEGGNEPSDSLKATGKNTTIDEMLTLFRGRCPFEVFLKEKPGKYGILIRLFADCDYRYVHCMDVYAVKQEGTTPESRGPRKIVKRLVAPIKDSGRNVTTDLFYTSIELAEDLYKCKITLVGTMKNNRKHIPEELKP
ncbi:hypothetical protein ANN_19665 [Periplaneta americana]|uniref:PiggyBac transposable element-derived protein domain-containing protein n=1 Tax=Periplaneta americana TaxID=6978 RepID=A0ABQ8SAU2_PERAM|nr:hypothetical protein ANN_19665 [Periplaneta americana]